MSSVTDDEANVLLLGESDACHHIIGAGHIDRIRDLVPKSARLVLRGIWRAHALLEVRQQDGTRRRNAAESFSQADWWSAWHQLTVSAEGPTQRSEPRTERPQMLDHDRCLPVIRS